MPYSEEGEKVENAHINMKFPINNQNGYREMSSGN
jgi:hypothetical protein